MSHHKTSHTPTVKDMTDHEKAAIVQEAEQHINQIMNKALDELNDYLASLPEWLAKEYKLNLPIGQPQ